MNAIVWVNVALCILLSAAILARAMLRRPVLKRQALTVRRTHRVQ